MRKRGVGGGRGVRHGVGVAREVRKESVGVGREVWKDRLRSREGSEA